MSISYTKLSTNFAKVKDKKAEEIGKLIGGKLKENIDSDKNKCDMEKRWQNMCAVRMSFALNYSGLTINYIPNQTSSGADGKWYIYRVPVMAQFIRKNIGVKPIIKERIEDLIGIRKRGIIIYTECGFDDANGHVDLFNGFTVEGKGYPECGKIEFCELPL